MENESDIKHVADTALWVATYRAQETERTDALFHDPMARVLAGERGQKIAAAMPFPKIMNWILVIRTIAIDRLIGKAISLGIDTVLNLGAGLDTRPYRMKLPTSLRWIEVDFPNMIDFKSQKLAAEKPVCRLERLASDLSDVAARRKLLEGIGSASKNVLVITEGVIPYLSSGDAASLSQDLFAVTTFQYWIQDYRQGGQNQWAPRSMKRALKDSPFKFDAVDWMGFFTRQGWAVGENLLAYEEGLRVGRPFPFIFPWSLVFYILPRKKKEQYRAASGYVMYKRPA